MSANAGFFQRIKGLSLAQKHLFALALTQRMKPNFDFFWQQRGGELAEQAQKQFDITLQLLWQKCYDRKLKVNYETHFDKLDLVTPEPDEEELYAARPAADAVVSLVVMLNALESKNDEELVNVSKLSTATVLGFVEAFDHQDLEGDALKQHCFEHPMLQEEKAVQQQLLDWVEQANPADAEQTKALRRELCDHPISNLGIEL
ncbi:DUF416 family protein [Paraferrimonas sedimenticola]|uniref:DUF416 family protein n=1 Tax=Paraferrimonas sedimenticola TaxID=375674 RepID=A0AA37RWU1_9GAMM|nr:DUF416 family protein [Paraferrimonas sedimenticola]GLP96876.1 hypothetical protein GCM10007895_21820 [Paraferrimonas sedimenticola]